MRDVSAHIAESFSILERIELSATLGEGALYVITKGVFQYPRTDRTLCNPGKLARIYINDSSFSILERIELSAT